MGWQALEHGAGQCGFAGAHFPGQQNKTAFPVQAILKMGHRLAMMITGIQKPRVGNNREGFPNKTKMLEINTHSARLLCCLFCLLVLQKIFQLPG